MTIAFVFGLLATGLAIGVVSGLVGIGGGVLVVPALVLLFGFEQTRATGTSLALLTMPVLFLAVVRYHQAGLVAWPHALLLAAGYVGGAWAGATLVTGGAVPREALRVAFALMLVLIAASFLFRRGSDARLGLAEAAAVSAAAAAWLVTTLIGRRPGRRRTSAASAGDAATPPPPPADARLQLPDYQI